MYMLGAHLVTTYSGKPYTQFVQERIWDRLNMSSTTFSPSRASQDGKLTQSWSQGRRRLPFWFSEESIELNAGARGVITNVEDMASDMLKTSKTLLTT